MHKLWIPLLILAQAGSAGSKPGVHVPGDDLRHAAQASIESGAKGSDTPLRMIETPGANVGVGVVYRAKGHSPSGSSSHDKVTEVYQVLEGEGVLVTGGEIVDPQRRDSAAALVGQVNGPGVSGSAIAGGVSQRVKKGDIVIVPAGTPHWFSDVDEAITVSVVRIDPGRVVALK